MRLPSGKGVHSNNGNQRQNATKLLSTQREFLNLVLLDSKARESLHRDIRDQDPEVWVPACHQLGESAARDQSAYNALCELLVSPLSELQLKGLVALRTMAPAKPEEVLMFLADRVDEARTHYDPVLLDAVFFAFTALPDQLGRKAVEIYLKDPDEGVRSAAAASLGSWSVWPDGTLLNLAHDSSVLVRAGLIASLAELDDSSDRTRAIDALQENPEPYLEALLEDLFENLPDPPAGSAPGPLNSDEARLLLNESHTRPVDLARYEQMLAEDPAQSLGLLRLSLEQATLSGLLGALSEVSRDISLAALFRVWLSIAEVEPESSARDLLLQLLGILQEESVHPDLQNLRDFVKACAEAADCAGSSDLVAWSAHRHVVCAQELQRTADDPSEFVALEAWQALDTLANIAGEFQNRSLFQLSSLQSELTELSFDIESACPRPERDLLLALTAHWKKIIQSELDDLMGGGGAS